MSGKVQHEANNATKKEPDPFLPPIDQGLATAGSKGQITVWDRGNGVWEENNRRIGFSAPRFIAHELAHALYACEGNLRIAMEIPSGPDFTGDIGGLNWTAKRAWFQDRGEYDAVINYENHVALELGELPRFSKRG